MLPLIFTDEELEQLDTMGSTDEAIPSKTYKINFETGEIYAEFVDLADAIAQAVKKAINTPRDSYLIYSSNYGCEIHDLKGKGFTQEYLELEVPRLINEALMIDDRITGTENYKIEKNGDELHISLDVITNVSETVRVEVAV